MKNLIFLLLPLLLPTDERNKCSNWNDFDSKIWKIDSLGCMGLRYKNCLSKNLYCNRDKLIGRNKQQIIDLLGPPNSIGFDTFSAMTNFSYFVLPGTQCGLGQTYEERMAQDVPMLEILSKNDSVIYIYLYLQEVFQIVMIPHFGEACTGNQFKIITSDAIEFSLRI